ncbi:MAG: alpha/beta hydrolase [Flavobacteriaceae bacterium]|nr:alpha/beta hydrolase [Flavobacteriaceae bacterium]
MKVQKKIPIYLVPGMAANASIFDNLVLDNKQFELYKLEWFVPEPKMSMREYALKLLENVKDESPVLLGVSFGGVVVQEMAKYCNPQKVILVSSIKTKSELPPKMRFAAMTNIHKLLPTRLISNVELLAKYALGEKIKSRLDLYKTYLSVNDPEYLNWAIDKMMHYDNKEVLSNCVHIHGDKDPVFPIKYIKDCVVVENGTHIMILNKARRISMEIHRILLG